MQAFDAVVISSPCRRAAKSVVRIHNVSVSYSGLLHQPQFYGTNDAKGVDRPQIPRPCPWVDHLELGNMPQN